MSTVQSRVLTKTVYEWTVPTELPYGAAHAQVHQGLAFAARKFAEIHGREPEYDDDMWVTVGDSEIIIRFEVEDAASLPSATDSEEQR